MTDLTPVAKGDRAPPPRLGRKLPSSKIRFSTRRGAPIPNDGWSPTARAERIASQHPWATTEATTMATAENTRRSVTPPAQARTDGTAALPGVEAGDEEEHHGGGTEGDEVLELEEGGQHRRRGQQDE